MHPSEFELHARIEDEHWWFRARREIIDGLIDRYAPQAPGSRLLEVGCGTGGNLRYFAGKYQVSGMELDATAATIARATTRCEILTKDICALTSDDAGHPDLIVLADVLEHIDDDRAALTAAVNLLSSGGVLIITVPADPRLWSAHDVALGHHRRYTFSSLAQLTDAQPVRRVFTSAFNTLLYPVVRLVRAVNRDGGEASDLKQHSRLANALLYRIFVTELALLKRRAFTTGCSLISILVRT